MKNFYIFLLILLLYFVYLIDLTINPTNKFKYSEYLKQDQPIVISIPAKDKYTIESYVIDNLMQNKIDIKNKICRENKLLITINLTHPINKNIDNINPCEEKLRIFNFNKGDKIKIELKNNNNTSPQSNFLVRFELMFYFRK